MELELGEALKIIFEMKKNSILKQLELKKRLNDPILKEFYNNYVICNEELFKKYFSLFF